MITFAARLCAWSLASVAELPARVVLWLDSAYDVEEGCDDA